MDFLQPMGSEIIRVLDPKGVSLRQWEFRRYKNNHREGALQ
jgi:hypothetical protein